MASAAREGAGSGRRRPPPRWALPGLLLLCLWLPGGRAAGSPSAPLSELHAQLSGVEQLLEEFRRQLQQERPQEELELELRAAATPGRLPGARPDAIIRTKDSIAAGASFLSAPAAVRDWRQCLQACCLEPHCSVAVVELPRRPAPPAAALGCSLFNCTWRGRSVSKFALHRGYSSYSLSRALRASRKDEPPLSKAGQDVVLHLPTDGVILDGRESTDDHAIVQYEWTLLQGDPTVDMKVIHVVIVKKTNVSNRLVGSPCSPRASQESSPTPQFKSINSSALSFLHSPTLISIHDYWKNHSLD
uniref:MANSC domain-containing protein n=1 Tax=Capra hircus TaxID=9925 RepID=A0A452F9J8_CAPHI